MEPDNVVVETERELAPPRRGPECVGTRSVQIECTVNGDESPKPATMAAFRRSRVGMATAGDDGVGVLPDDEAIALMLTDGRVTYWGRIRDSEVKGRKRGPEKNIPPYSNVANEARADRADADEDDAALAMVKSHILGDSTGASVSYVTQQGGISENNGDFPSRMIKVTVRERMDGGVVRIVWVGYLSNEDEGGRAPTQWGGSLSTALPFASSLALSFKDALDEIYFLRRERDGLKLDLEGWKDTVSKLDSEGQVEKDELLDRFLVLLNRVKSDLRKARKHLEDERKKTKNGSSVIQSDFPSALFPPKKELVDLNDGHDYEIFDTEEVERLAAGPLQKGTTRSRDHDCIMASREEPPLHQPSEESWNESQPLVRRDPHTGAILVWGEPSGSLLAEESQGGNVDDISAKRGRVNINSEDNTACLVMKPIKSQTSRSAHETTAQSLPNGGKGSRRKAMIGNAGLKKDYLSILLNSDSDVASVDLSEHFSTAKKRPRKTEMPQSSGLEIGVVLRTPEQAKQIKTKWQNKILSKNELAVNCTANSISNKKATKNPKKPSYRTLGTGLALETPEQGRPSGKGADLEWQKEFFTDSESDDNYFDRTKRGPQKKYEGNSDVI